ncbi:MAG: hypothetical protein R2749_27985 [Acidimicrobiales bacterium]
MQPAEATPATTSGTAATAHHTGRAITRQAWAAQPASARRSIRARPMRSPMASRAAGTATSAAAAAMNTTVAPA